MDPITLGIIGLILSGGTTAYSIGKQNQANLKAKRDGQAAVDAKSKQAQSEQLALDAQYLADVRQAALDAQATQVASEAKAARLKTLFRVSALLTIGLTMLLILKFTLNARLTRSF